MADVEHNSDKRVGTPLSVTAVVNMAIVALHPPIAVQAVSPGMAFATVNPHQRMCATLLLPQHLQFPGLLQLLQLLKFLH